MPAAEPPILAAMEAEAAAVLIIVCLMPLMSGLPKLRLLAPEVHLYRAAMETLAVTQRLALF